MRKAVGLFILMSLSLCSFAQVRKIPALVTETFSRQYPLAKDVEYRDQLTGYTVEFRMDSAKMVAHYTNKGDWKDTEKTVSYDELPAEVKDGFHKSKYAQEWKPGETVIIYQPAKETYRVKVEKNEVQKKYLYFDKTGRLQRDAITL